MSEVRYSASVAQCRVSCPWPTELTAPSGRLQCRPGEYGVALAFSRLGRNQIRAAFPAPHACDAALQTLQALLPVMNERVSESPPK